MPRHDDVLDFQVIDGVVDDGLGGHVVRGDDVGDVAVDEDVARLGGQEGGFGAAAVGAAEPEGGRALALGAFGEEVGVLGLGFGGEGFVLGEEGVEGGGFWGCLLVILEGRGGGVLLFLGEDEGRGTYFRKTC